MYIVNINLHSWRILSLIIFVLILRPAKFAYFTYKLFKDDAVDLIQKSHGTVDAPSIENVSLAKLPNTTSLNTAATNQVLRDSNESHLVEDRALERLGRLLSASASIFSSKADEDIVVKDNSETISGKLDETMIQNNNGEDLMSTSDTSSHLWQGISGKKES